MTSGIKTGLFQFDNNWFLVRPAYVCMCTSKCHLIKYTIIGFFLDGKGEF